MDDERDGVEIGGLGVEAPSHCLPILRLPWSFFPTPTLGGGAGREARNSAA